MSFLLAIIVLIVLLLPCIAFGKAVEKITYNMIKYDEERQNIYFYSEEDHQRYTVRRKPNTRRLYRKR